MSNPDDHATDLDDFDSPFGPDFDAEIADDVNEEETLTRSAHTRSAWQRLDERKDAEWLREQLSDWDDWDDAEIH